MSALHLNIRVIRAKAATKFFYAGIFFSHSAFFFRSIRCRRRRRRNCFLRIIEKKKLLSRKLAEEKNKIAWNFQGLACISLL